MNLQTLVTLGTYAFPVAILGCLLAVNSGLSVDGTGFTSIKWTTLFWLSTSGLVGYMVLLAVAHWGRRITRKDLWFSVAAAGVVVVVCVSILEVALRFVTSPHPFGRQLGAMVIKPYEWNSAAAFNTQLYENSLEPAAYYVGHPEFGWEIGSARISKDGLYESSVEGLRSRTAGDKLFEVQGKPRIALFGNSFIFSEEVGFDDSLTLHMDKLVGNQYQVVNFGVPGYGIDQAYLRYLKSVDKWAPKIAILGFIQDDLNRAADVYTFMKPSWGIPFSKPRFTVSEGALKLQNIPNLQPADMYASESISELPFLELDRNYRDFHWRYGFQHSLLLVRTLFTVFPRYGNANEYTDDDAIANVGMRIASEFVEHAVNRGIQPVVVYVPSKSDFSGVSLNVKRLSMAKAKATGLEVADVTPCLTEKVDKDSLYVVGGVHYSGAGNQAFAQCLIDIVGLESNN